MYTIVKTYENRVTGEIKKEISHSFSADHISYSIFDFFSEKYRLIDTKIYDEGELLMRETKSEEDTVMKIRPMICERCGGTINPKTMQCEFCNTYYMVEREVV